MDTSVISDLAVDILFTDHDSAVLQIHEYRDICDNKSD